MDRVTVFRFKIYEEGTDMDTLAPRAATAETIRQIMDATLVVGTAQVVDRHCIDSHGFLVQGPS
jgi:hypothetical protein